MSLLLVALCLAALGLSCVYQWWWHQRYRRPTIVDRELVRLRGRVVGPETGETVLEADRRDTVSNDNALELIDQNGRPQTIGVDGSVPLIGSRLLRVGDRLTVDAVWTTARRQEVLCREHGLERRIDAVRLMAGTWPRALWLPLILLGLTFIAEIRAVAALGLTDQSHRQVSGVHAVLVAVPRADDVGRELVDAVAPGSEDAGVASSKK